MASRKIKVANPVVDLDGDEMTRCARRAAATRASVGPDLAHTPACQGSRLSSFCSAARHPYRPHGVVQAAPRSARP